MRSNDIRNFKQMTITGDELENIFIPDKRKVCQTCHKVRIKTLISKYFFLKIIEKISAVAKDIIIKIPINKTIINMINRFNKMRILINMVDRFHRKKSKIIPDKILKKMKMNLILNLRRMKKEISM